METLFTDTENNQCEIIMRKFKFNIGDTVEVVADFTLQTGSGVRKMLGEKAIIKYAFFDGNANVYTVSPLSWPDKEECIVLECDMKIVLPSEMPAKPGESKEAAIEHLIRQALVYIGENPYREGLTGTPDRIRRMWQELFRGYDEKQKPKITVFKNGVDGLSYDNMVIDSGDYYSLCEHHAMPFFGQYFFAYIPHPKGKILGLSKVARVVDYCAARLQIQERLTRDIVKMIEGALTEGIEPECAPLGMALVMKGHHLCKEMRGARKKGLMTTSYLTGVFRTDNDARAEFMRFVNSTHVE